MKMINEVIIVEGKHDISFLKSFIEGTFIKTNGTSLSSDVLDEIEIYKKQNKDFIILTDPDYPGTYIRNKLLEKIPNAKVCFIPKEFAKTTKKVGIEHSTKEVVLKSLENLATFSNYEEKIFLKDLINYGYSGLNDSSIRRDNLCNELFLGKCNAKQLLYRLNCLGYKREELIEILNKYK